LGQRPWPHPRPFGQTTGITAFKTEKGAYSRRVWRDVRRALRSGILRQERSNAFGGCPFFVMPTVSALVWKNMIMHPVYGLISLVLMTALKSRVDAVPYLLQRLQRS
jgi:hypothetical protein